ncbi:MAG TPA: hypothetical protein DDW52_24335 [Planctomycetaceae bacterium]|nr:hypothetical protein [Planctomycetaceae bacterium]
MVRLLVQKFVRESQFLFLALASLLVLFCASRVWIAGQFDLSSFKPLLEQLRRFERFMPVPLDHVLTYSGSIALTLSEPLLIFSILTWCIARGSDVISGEIGRGSLEMLLANPISRTKIVLTHYILSAVGLGLLCLTIWTTIHIALKYCSVRETVSNTATFTLPFVPVQVPIQLGEPEEVLTPLASRVDSSIFVVPCINLFAFGFFVLSLAVGVSCVDRYRWRCIGVTLAIYVLQLLIFLLSKVGTSWRGLEWATVLSLYQPDLTALVTQRIEGSQWTVVASEAMQDSVWRFTLGPIGMTGILTILGLTVVTSAIAYLNRRDLPAPL